MRNALVVAEAQSKGITVTDDEVNNYMQTNFKTTDVSQVASAYKLSEDVAKKLINDAVIMKKYRDSVLTTTLPDAPQAPTAPEDGNSETTSQEYAQYIIGLAGESGTLRTTLGLPRMAITTSSSLLIQSPTIPLLMQLLRPLIRLQ